MPTVEPVKLSSSVPTTPPNDSLPKYLQEDDMTQERKDFVSSLPIEKGWVANHLHQYQGFWHTTRQLHGVLTCQKHFQAQDSDILLVTNPKSGTTWLKALTFALVNRLDYVDHPENHPLLKNNPHELVPFLEVKLYIENQVPDLTTLTSPRIFSSHLPYVSLPKSVSDSACKLVYLCRNPKDTFVSLWHFTNNLRLKEKGANSLEEAFEKFCRGVSLSGPYWDHVLDYWKASLERPERVLFLKFEELKQEPALHLRRLAEFLGCPFSPEEEASGLVDSILKLCSFDNLSNLEVNKTGILSSGEEYKAFFRRGEVGDWKNHLTSEMIQRMDKITEEKMQASGLKF
ncbi:hypothetical protein ACOSP7_017844 [Xanthoceras sorbifolium]|uniref:Sulfotransferase n=1 Tax=Xanthoceras sorbifolium TaxID=99658 RepID=A0ABQ8I006_9ROSI|nr:hypothetical protein JRO89_XS05G0023400 [Xanthoceras sorbifolium]